MKKIISILMAAMCLIIFSGTAFAEGDDSLTSKQSEAISLLNDIGIFSDITVDKASEAITRAEFAQIIVRIVGGEADLTDVPRRIYTDVLPEQEAAASIEYLYDRGIMVGYDTAEFKPDEIITVGEVVKVMIIITGYTSWAENAGGYPEGYYAQAVTNNILSGVSGKVAERISYADAAVIIQNVLESRDYVRVTGYKGNDPVEVKINDEEYMSYKLNIYRYTGIVEAYGDTALSGSDESYNTDTCKIGGELLQTGGFDFSPYLGMRVKVYYREDDYNGSTVLHITNDSKNIVTEIKDADISDSTTKSLVQYYEGSKLKRAQISSQAVFMCNGKRLDVVTDTDLIVGNGSLKLISNDGDSSYDVVIIKSYDTFIVDKAMTADCAVNLKYGKGTLDFDDDFKTKYYIDGSETDFSSITSGSVLSVAFSKNTSGDILAEVYIANNIVTGKAVSIHDGDKRGVELEDGSRFDFTNEYSNRIAYGDENTYEPVLGEEGSFYIDYFNQIAAYTLSVTSKEYAYVVKCWYDENEETGAIRLFTKDGEFKDIGFADKIKVNNVNVSNADIPDMLKQSGENGTVNQLVVYGATEDGQLQKLQLAVNKTTEDYYIASEDEFVLNAHPKNSQGVACGVRFYKNMAEDRPYTFVDGQTIQFMIPADRSNEKAYKIATKLKSTDVSLPAPLYFYDAGAAGAIGAVVSNTASEGSYSTPVIIDKVVDAIDEEGDECKLLQFVGGTSIYAKYDDVIYDQPTTNWSTFVDYSTVTIDDLKRGDIIEYTTSNEKVEMLRVVVRVDDIGPIRIDGDHIQKNGNMIADVISVSNNGRTALVRYVNRNGSTVNQTMLVNGTTYRYDSSSGKVYNSSAADLREGDRILINSFWWSPKLVVIFR